MKRKKGKYYLSNKMCGTLSFVFLMLIAIIILLFWLKEKCTSYEIYFEIAINLFIVIMSIVGTSILSTLLIEKKNNNSVYFDTILNDVISDKKVFDLISVDNKEILKKYLLNIQSNAELEMFNHIYNTLFAANSDYYFEECSYVIDCSVRDDYIEKKIVKKLKIFSYKKTKTVRKFAFVRMSADENVSYKHLDVKSILINNNVLKENQYELKTENVADNEVILKKSNYAKKYTCVAKRSIKLYDTIPTEICINYITRVATHDKNMCCRVSEPCKKFSVDFTVMGEDSYDICTSGFGFMNSAAGTLNSMNNPNNVKMTFDNWIFKKDGVSIGFSPK